MSLRTAIHLAFVPIEQVFDDEVDRSDLLTQRQYPSDDGPAARDLVRRRRLKEGSDVVGRHSRQFALNGHRAVILATSRL